MITELVEDWAKERGLDKLDPSKQMLKLMEEVGELATAIAKNQDISLIEDSLGDTQVVLTILALQLGLKQNQAFRKAYNVIRDRKGKTVNGVFIKQEDL